jgi:hypothetical protein
MKYNLVYLVIISILLSSCTSVGTGIKADPKFVSSLPSQSLEIIQHEILSVNPDRISGEYRDSFKQVLRIGDGTLHFVDYEDPYPLPRGGGSIKIISYDPNAAVAKKYCDFNVDYKKYNMEAFKVERYNVPQYQFPLAFFDIQYEVKNEFTPTKPYFLHYLSSNTQQTELWFTNSSISFTHKIATIDHFKPYPKPMAYYNNYIDYYNGWIAYVKGNDIHLINLFAELSMVEDKSKLDRINEFLKSKKNSFTLDLGLYKQNQKNRMIAGAFNSIFKPNAPEDMKRLLHLHELKNHILLCCPTQNNTEMIYLFDKQFSKPPDVFEFEKDHYRIFRGNDTDQGHPMMIMFDSFADEIELYDIVSKERSSIDLKGILAPVDRKINNLFLTKNKKGYELILFPEAFSDIKTHYFLILELDEKKNPIQHIKVHLKTDQLHHFYQVLYRSQEKDFILLTTNRDRDSYYLMEFSLENRTTKIDAMCFQLTPFSYMIGDLQMLYHPGGYFVLQNTLTADEYQDFVVGVDFYNLLGINALAKSNEVK